jgi:hypothetical protein
VKKYTIKAHPTKYGGVMFRSRLEARWAAFFDLLGWVWRYEPIDLDGWTPDFYLKFPCGHSECGGFHELYVEVKPYSDDEEFKGHFVSRVSWGSVFDEFGNESFLGVDGGGRFGLTPDVARFCICHGDGGGDLDLRFFVPGDGNCGQYQHSVSAKLWNEAGNIVQWTPRRNP